MSFTCKNYIYESDTCRKLHSECIPGRPGCVLEGRVVVSEELEKKIRQLEEKTAKRRQQRRKE